jgi:rod shape-determining protein MreC
LFSRFASVLFVLFIGVLVIALSRVRQVQVVESLLFEVVGTAETGISIPIVRLDQVGRTIESIGQIRTENARLRAEVDRLTQQAVLVPELQRENAELRAELGFQHEEPQFRWTNARLIGFDPSNLIQAIIVDQGTQAGVAEGMTVVTPRGLVGQIVQATPNTAKVLLITDVSSSTNALIQSSRAKGVVNGSRNGQLLMTFIPQGVKVQTGDRVVTSGIGGVFPEGLVVGTVTDVRQNDVDLFQTAQLEPAVDIGQLEEVMVIINHLPIKLR